MIKLHTHTNAIIASSLWGAKQPRVTNIHVRYDDYRLLSPLRGLAVMSVLLLTVTMGYVPPAWAAREAAFIDPSQSSKAGEESVIVEPKAETDLGESVVKIARRSTVFFSNRTSQAIAVDNININGDANVQSEIVSDDCSKLGTIAAGSRCGVTAEITPLSPGAWTVELTMTHKGSGRMARARLIGKTTGAKGIDADKETGLSLSTKDVKPVDFGEVTLDGTKVVRSALMVNDSQEPIKILSIEVIAADNGLSRLEQGCITEMELKPTESCPITLIWQPNEKGVVSTDLIIRHTGRLGFAVIPLRGKTSGEGGGNYKGGINLSSPPPMSDADAVEAELTGGFIPLSADLLPTGISDTKGVWKGGKKTASGTFQLIGTSGSRAILLTPDGTTSIVGKGDEIQQGSTSAKLVTVTAKAAELTVNGQKVSLTLQSSEILTDRATQAAESSQQQKADTDNKDKKSAKKDSEGDRKAQKSQ